MPSGWEAATFEVALLLAPLAAALVARHGVTWVFACAAVLLCGAWIVMPHAAESDVAAIAWGWTIERRVAGMLVLALLLGVSGWLLQPGLAALPTIGEVRGSEAACLLIMGVGSLAGAVMAARWEWPTRPGDALPLLGLYAAALVVAATTSAWTRGGALLVAGMPIAPLNSLGGLVVDGATDRRHIGGSFGAVAASLMLGEGMGQAAAAGLATTTAPTALVLLAAASAAAGVVLLVLVRACSAVWRRTWRGAH